MPPAQWYLKTDAFVPKVDCRALPWYLILYAERPDWFPARFFFLAFVRCFKCHGCPWRSSDMQMGKRPLVTSRFAFWSCKNEKKGRKTKLSQVQTNKRKQSLEKKNRNPRKRIFKVQKINSVHFSTISRFIFLLPFPGLFFFFQDCDVNIVFVVTVRPGECRWDRRRLFRKSAGGLEVECRPYNNHYSAEMAIWRRLSVPRPETPWLDFPRVAILPRLRVLPFHWSPIPATFSHPHCTSTSNPKRMCRLEKSPSHAQKRSVLFFFFFIFILSGFLFFETAEEIHTFMHQKGMFNSESQNADHFQKLFESYRQYCVPACLRTICRQRVQGAAAAVPPPWLHFPRGERAISGVHLLLTCVSFCHCRAFNLILAFLFHLSSASLPRWGRAGELGRRLSSRRPSVPLMRRPALSAMQDNQLTWLCRWWN